MNPQDNNQDVNTQNQAMPGAAPVASMPGNAAPSQAAPDTNPVGEASSVSTPAPSVDAMQPNGAEPIQPMATAPKPKKSKSIVIVVIVVVVLAIAGAVLLLG